MQRILSLLFLMLFSIVSFGQGQADNWYFGLNAGVTFNSGTPVGLTNGALSTSEGCATISDENGNLIFYTDGRFAYNRNHQQMPNGFGMLGNPSSAQSAIIVPKPGDETRYFIFTVAANGGVDGFRYSEVDMTLDGGLGDVVVATKNTLLFTPSVEKIAAVGHANGFYFWVIGHGLNNNRYYAYLVDCNGVQAPVTSDVGQVEGVPGWGCLTASPDGTKLAAAMRVPGFELLDFNNSTGVVSNPLLLHVQNGAYGISFSPNSQVLYALSIEVGDIFQWNLQAGNPANIVASRQIIGIAEPIGSTGYQGGTIQQGPDAKLYIPDRGQPFLSVINNPNTVGVGCNLQHDAVDLLGRTVILGLPPFIASFFDTTEVIGFDPICQGSETMFEILDETAFLDSVHWDFGEPSSGVNNSSSLINPGHTYANAGNYQVELIRYIDCISDTNYTEVTIEPYPVFNQTEEICADETFTLPSGIVVSTTGIYHDTIPDALGCDSVVITDLTVHPLPVLTITSDTAICDGATLQLSATGAHNVVWDPLTDLSNSNIPNPVFSGTSAQTYTITGTNITGCESTGSVAITINPNPVVDAGLDESICAQETVQLTATGATDYVWNTSTDLDDSAIANPTFSGSNTATLTVTGTDANGCFASDDVTVTVNPTPTASFNQPTDVCLGFQTEFVDNSTGNSIDYNWDFGDGNSSAASDPIHTYATDGTFNVILEVTDANGCQSSATQTATVFPLPQPVMNVTDGEEFCEYEVIQFENLTPGTFASVLWDFGDNDFLPAFPNSQSTLNNPTFCYYNFAFSPYTVMLVITDNNGCLSINQTVIEINDKPTPDFSSSIECEDSATEFTDLSSSFSSNINSWEWDFGDNLGSSTNQNPTYQYQNDGVYTAELIVGNSAGCLDTVANLVIVNPVPTVALSEIDTCLNDEMAFTNLTVPQDQTISIWNWNFGDGNSINTQEAAHTYTDFGLFTATLTATTDSGCVASGTTQVEVFPNPEPDFTLQEAVGCTPHEVLFINETSIATGALDQYVWQLGDGTSSTSPNLVHTYPDSGYYDVSLLAISAKGCSTELTVTDAIRANITPVADFDILNDKVNLLDAELELTESSEHALTWSWDFGDGGTSTDIIPTHNYTEPGIYDVVLHVTNGDCEDFAFGRIVVYPLFTFYIPSAFTPDDDGINETFFGTGESIRIYNMKISDRWGELLFESNDPDFHWDGTYKGKPVEAGLYVYEFYILDEFARDHTYAGHFHLLR